MVDNRTVTPIPESTRLMFRLLQRIVTKSTGFGLSD
jgi:hypothetical protein